MGLRLFQTSWAQRTIVSNREHTAGEAMAPRNLRMRTRVCVWAAQVARRNQRSWPWRLHTLTQTLNCTPRRSQASWRTTSVLTEHTSCVWRSGNMCPTESAFPVWHFQVSGRLILPRTLFRRMPAVVACLKICGLVCWVAVPLGLKSGTFFCPRFLF